MSYYVSALKTKPDTQQLVLEMAVSWILSPLLNLSFLRAGIISYALWYLSKYLEKYLVYGSSCSINIYWPAFKFQGHRLVYYLSCWGCIYLKINCDPVIWENKRKHLWETICEQSIPYLETGSLQNQSVRGGHTRLEWVLNTMTRVSVREGGADKEAERRHREQET